MIAVPIAKKMVTITSIEFVPFHGLTLIVWKMVKRKTFLANPKDQDRVSHYREHDCGPNNKRNEDYYK